MNPGQKPRRRGPKPPGAGRSPKPPYVYRPSLWDRFTQAIAKLVAVAFVIALVPLVIWVAQDAAVRHYNHKHHITVSKPAPGTRSPTPAMQAVDRALETLRLKAKEAFYDPAVAEHQAQTSHRRRKPGARPTPTFAVVGSPTLRIELTAKRIVDGPGDKDVPPHPQANALWDFKHLGSGWEEHPKSTTVHIYTTVTGASAKTITAMIGRLAVRDRDGKTLFVWQYHVPEVAEKGVKLGIPKGFKFHQHFTHQRAADFRYRDVGGSHPRFRDILYTPLSEMTLEWSPYFVEYEDGSMEGDAHALFYIDGEGVPVEGYDNSLYWILAKQYPKEFPDATENTMIPAGYRPDGTMVIKGRGR